MSARLFVCLTAAGAILIVVGSLGPWLVVEPAIVDVGFVVFDERDRDWRLALALLILGLVTVGLAAAGRRAATWPAALFALGVVVYHGGVDDSGTALWFGLLALVVTGLAASGRRGVAWLAIPFCLGSSLIAGYFLWMIPRAFGGIRWPDVPDVLAPAVPGVEDVVRPGWGLYAVLIGGLLGGLLASALTLAEGGADRHRQ